MARAHRRSCRQGVPEGRRSHPPSQRTCTRQGRTVLPGGALALPPRGREQAGIPAAVRADSAAAPRQRPHPGNRATRVRPDCGLPSRARRRTDRPRLRGIRQREHRRREEGHDRRGPLSADVQGPSGPNRRTVPIPASGTGPARARPRRFRKCTPHGQGSGSPGPGERSELGRYVRRGSVPAGRRRETNESERTQRRTSGRTLHRSQQSRSGRRPGATPRRRLPRRSGDRRDAHRARAISRVGAARLSGLQSGPLALLDRGGAGDGGCGGGRGEIRAADRATAGVDGGPAGGGDAARSPGGLPLWALWRLRRTHEGDPRGPHPARTCADQSDRPEGSHGHARDRRLRRDHAGLRGARDRERPGALRPPQRRIGQGPTGRRSDRRHSGGNGSRSGESDQGRKTAADQVDEVDVVRAVPLDTLLRRVPHPRWSRPRATARSWAGRSPRWRGAPPDTSSWPRGRETARQSRGNSHRSSRCRSKRLPARCPPAAFSSSSPTASRCNGATIRGDKPYTSERHYAPTDFGGLMSQADAFVVQLADDERPTKWYNIQADLPEPLPPPKDPATGPSRIKALPDLLVGECLRQENSMQRWIDIPTEIQDLYRQAGRPRPLIRARRLEERLGTPAHLYYKTEFYSPTGSHKVNTALAQAWYAKQEGYERLTTETGAGQWGTALAYAASLAGLKTTVFWVRAVHDWKTQRRQFMRLYGATVHASPSPETATGRALLEKDPHHPGSLGIAVSEGLEDAGRDDKAIYCLGSVLNHVLLHQTVIGLETQRQFEQIGEYPDLMVSSLGGGSNFGGFTLPFFADAFRGKAIRFLAAQSAAAPNLQGEYRDDVADHAELTPMLKMYTLGHRAEMKPVRGDGLRYHGCSPLLSLLRHRGLIDTIAYQTDERHVFERARVFVQTEGFLPAPESAYSIACAIDEALKAKETGERPVIAFNVSGHGFMDMEGYADVLGL